MRIFLIVSFTCLAFLTPASLFADDSKKKTEETKKEKKDDCKDDSCKKPEK